MIELSLIGCIRLEVRTNHVQSINKLCLEHTHYVLL